MRKRFRSSIAFKLALFVLCGSVAVFSIVLLYSYVYSRQIILDEAKGKALNLALAMSRKIEQQFIAVGKLPKSLAGFLESSAFDQKTLFSVMKRMVSDNSEIYGMAVAFQPYAFDWKTQAYAPYFYKTGQGLGVSIAEVNLKLIWDVVSQIKVGEHGHAYVVGPQGRLIAHPDISLVLRNTDMSKLVQVQAAQAGGSGVDPDSLQGTRNIQGQEVLTASAPIQPLGWTMFVELPVEEAYASLYLALQRLALVLAAASIFAVLAGIFLARRMVGPIQALRAGAERIGSGDFTQRISINTGDELEGLANQFNDMGARLQESYADLEHKVEQRTAELSESLEQQTATSEVLEVISSSPGELEPVFRKMLENAARVCGANFGTINLWDGEKYNIVADHNIPPEFSAFRQRTPILPHPGTTLQPLSRRISRSRSMTSGTVRVIGPVFPMWLGWSMSLAPERSSRCPC